ncbi:hypothetical protein pb186bvf_006512 [Paramecium bursaria]
MQKNQLISWIANIIQTKLKPQGNSKFELESKIGKFQGKNHISRNLIQDVGELEQLDKSQIYYEFQSKIALKEYNRLKNYLGEKCIKLSRLDINYSKKEQRSSFILQDDQSLGVLIEKKKNQAQHLDIAHFSKNFRISLNQEITLSSSLKDIIAQMPQRIKNVNFLRLKETHLLELDSLEYSLSKVFQVSKNHPKFDTIVQKIQLFKFYNLKQSMEDIIKQFTGEPEYEFEIEIKHQKDLTEDESKQLAEQFLDRTEAMIDLIQSKDDDGEEEQDNKKQCTQASTIEKPKRKIFQDQENLAPIQGFSSAKKQDDDTQSEIVPIIINPDLIKNSQQQIMVPRPRSDLGSEIENLWSRAVQEQSRNLQKQNVKQYLEDGSFYEGEWFKGTMHGNGKLTAGNMVIYEGEFKLGVKEGQGIQYFTNRTYNKMIPPSQVSDRQYWSQYNGSFENDKMNGEGILELINGSQQLITWITYI